MGHILCATRGGEPSRRTQERAINLAQTRGDRLTFVYVADTGITPPGQAALAEVVGDELERLGHRLMDIAKARAREQGVVAFTVVRRGQVQPTLLAMLSQMQATTLVMGAPRAPNGEEQVSRHQISSFLDEVRALGIEVVVVD